MHTFKRIALYIEDEKDAELIHAFIWGLKYQVHQEVRLHNGHNLRVYIHFMQTLYRWKAY